MAFGPNPCGASLRPSSPSFDARKRLSQVTRNQPTLRFALWLYFAISRRLLSTTQNITTIVCTSAGGCALLFRFSGGVGVRLHDQEMELRDFSNLQGELATLKVIKTDLASRLATVGGHLEARCCLLHVPQSSSARESLPNSVLYAVLSYAGVLYTVYCRLYSVPICHNIPKYNQHLYINIK